MTSCPCWAEISLGQLKENLSLIRRHVGPERKVLGVVKANAYGHGAVPVARALEEAGIDFFGVAAVQEGVELRQAGVRTPVLVMTGFYPGEEKQLLQFDLTPGITELCQFGALQNAARAAGHRVRCHVKVDTGMGRLGIRPTDVPRLLELLASADALDFEGLYTHLASSEDFTSPQTAEQIACFERIRSQFAGRGFHPPLIHLANTGGVVARPEAWGNMVRPGSMLYGYLSFLTFPPGEDRSAEFAARLPVKPILTLKARIFQVRDYPARASVGYGARFVTKRPSRLAVLPIGYGYGLRRDLSGHCRVLVHGKSVPTVGTIGMDLTLADVTDIPDVRQGEEVVLVGSNGKLTIPPTDWALALGTVASELLIGLSSRIPRVYCP